MRDMSKSLAETYTMGSPIPDDLRKRDWLVAVHNDYRMDGKLMTFWLFTHKHYCVKGEAETDAEALNSCRVYAYILDHDVAVEEAEVEKTTADYVALLLQQIVKDHK